MRSRRISLVALAALLAASQASAQIDRILNGIAGRGGGSPASGLSDADAASGLKEALRVGAGNTVKLTGVVDGYFRNEAIKILLPEKLRAAEKPMRMMGMGSQLDAFVLSMNRAAEQAAPGAERFFKDAIMSMTFEDARGILTGGDTAATDFFKRRTGAQIATSFTPVVKEAMSQTGVGKQFEAVTASPLGRLAGFDLDSYVVGKSVDGLFYVLAQEEKKIRTNPAAQVTPLLRKVFGRN